jgi:sulfiredoxin
MSAINRPIPSQLDRQKVDNMKEVLQVPERENELTPIVSTFYLDIFLC